MQWLANLLRKRRLAVAIGFLLLIFLIWFVGWWWLNGNVVKCFLLTLTVLFMWILLLMLERVAAERGASRLEQSIKAQSEEEVMGVRPEKREELENLKRQFASAIDSLKKSKLGKGRSGRTALYALPWYMIIGPPAAGKTTAIRNSGLEFPFGADREIQGVGGTRNCDWWFTSSAILLDTAGRYTTQDDDREEWVGFLNILKKHRRRQPINGVLIGISIADLVNAGMLELEVHAKNIRNRVDELIQSLGIRFPVYLVFTKCDLLNGFVEFFEDFSHLQREQVWGCTLRKEELADPNPKAVFEHEMDVLYDSLVGMRLTRLASGMKRENRRLVYAFPLQFLAAKENLAYFVGKLLQPNPFQESPIFRGFYFTSGTQEGVPIDRVVQSIAHAFGLPPEVAEQFNPEMKTKSYFIKDLFTDIIIPDEQLVRLTSRSERNRSLARTGVLAIAVVGLLGFVLGVILGYDGSKSILKATASDIASLSRTARDSSASPQRLQLLMTRIQDLRNPPSLSFGMNRNASILGPVRTLYYRELRPVVQRKVVNVLEDRLRRSGQQRVNVYDDLKAYLLLTTQTYRLSGDQNLQSFLGRELRKVVDQKTAPWLNEHLDLFVQDYSEALDAGLTEPFSANANLVASARLKASKLDVGDLYARLKSRSAETQPFSFADGVIHSTHSVEGVFTKTGAQNMEALIDSELTEPGSEDTWVLALEQPQLAGSMADRNKVASSLRELYFKEYAAEWAKFLHTLEYDPCDDIAVVATRIKRIVDPSSSTLRHLLEQVVEQTRFESSVSKEVREKSMNLGVDITPHHPVDSRFANLHMLVEGKSGDTKTSDLAAVIAQLDMVGNVLESLKGAPSKKAKDFAATVLKGGGNELVQALGEIRRLLSTNDLETRDALRYLFEQPIRFAWKTVLMKTQEYLDEQWRIEIVEPYRQLAGSYPFDPASTRDAVLGDVAALFAADGKLWKYIANELRPFTTEGETWEPVLWEGMGVQLSPSTRDALKNATFVTRALFKGSDANVKAEVTLLQPEVPDDAPGFDRICMTIGGHEDCLRWKEKKPASSVFEWPGQQPARGAGIRLINERFLRSEEVVDELSFEGEWGLFRLLDSAHRGPGRTRAEYRYQWWSKERIGIVCLLKSENSISNPFSRNLGVALPGKLE